MQTDTIIICGSGASIPFETDRFKSEGQGLAPLLFETLQNNYTIGLNSWCKFGNQSTVNFVNDFQFYHNNYELIKALPLIVVRHDAQLYTKPKFALHENTLVLPDAKYYFGMDSWDIHNKTCLVCGWKIRRDDRQRYCHEHKMTKMMPIGFYHGHLAGLISTTLAIALGFKKIYLLGMDCNETNGKTHFYQDLITDFKEYFGVGKVNDKYRTSAYSDMAKLNNRYYAPLGAQTDAKIYNVSPHSGIDVFEKMDYTTFIDQTNGNSVNQEQARNEIKQVIIEKTK